MPGATSLIELILKKWGDGAAGCSTFLNLVPFSSNAYRIYMDLCGDVGPKNGLKPTHKPT